MSEHRLGLSGSFFREISVEGWACAREVGFENMEVIFNRMYLFDRMIDEARRMYNTAREAGLTPASAHLPFGYPWDPSTANLGHLRQLRGQILELLEMIAEWEVPIAVLHGSYEVIDPEERASRLAIARDSVAIFGQRAKELGITLAVENMPRTALGRTADEILYLTDNGRVASMCFDFNHLLIEDHIDFLQKCGHLAVTTHISDYDRVDEKHWMPGDGCIDYKKVLRCLDSVGYNGQLLFEVRHSRMWPGEAPDCATLYARWQSMMREHDAEERLRPSAAEIPL